jgi:hypothetical protein
VAFGPLQHFVLVAEAEHRHDRSEDFLADDLHLVLAAPEHGGLDIEAPGQGGIRGRAATAEQAGAALPGAPDVAQHPIPVLGGDQRAHLGGGVHGIADPQAPHARQQPVQEKLEQRLVDEHPSAVGADLTLGVEVGHQGRGDGIV